MSRGLGDVYKRQAEKGGFLKTFGEPDERHENFTIRCHLGSYAMQYARAQQIRCVQG